MRAYRVKSSAQVARDEERSLLAQLLVAGSDEKIEVCEARAASYLVEGLTLEALLAGPEKAAQLTEGDRERLGAAAEIARRCQPSAQKGAAITGPQDVLAEVSDIRTKQNENLVALYLDSHNRLLHRQVVGVGGVRAAVASPRDILAPALDYPTASLVVAHNHPSGDPDPSAEDLEVTRRLAQGCRTLGIELLDHLIVCKRGYRSLKELGAL